MVTPKSVLETTPLVLAWIKQRERTLYFRNDPRQAVTEARARFGGSRVHSTRLERGLAT